MSGKVRSPIPEDKMLAYIYDDVDDSDVFALEPLNSSSSENDVKVEEDIEIPKCKTAEVLEENEILKEQLKKVQAEKETLGLRISELYHTARAELQRKDRRIQELNEQRNNILFRTNWKFRGQINNVVDLASTKPERELKDKRFQENQNSIDNDQGINHNSPVNYRSSSKLLHREISHELVGDLTSMSSEKELTNKGLQKNHSQVNDVVDVTSVQSEKEAVNKEFSVNRNVNDNDQKNNVVDLNDKQLAKDLTNEANQKFDVKYKIPKRKSFENPNHIRRDTGVLSNSKEEVTSYCNRLQKHDKFQPTKPDKLDKNVTERRRSPHRRKSICLDVDSKICMSPPRDKEEKYRSKSRSRPRQPKTPPGSPSRRDLSHQVLRRKPRSLSRERFRDFPETKFTSRSRPRYENQRGRPRTPSKSPARDTVAKEQSRSLSRKRDSNRNNLRSRSEHRNVELCKSGSWDLKDKSETRKYFFEGQNETKLKKPPRTPPGSPSKERSQVHKGRPPRTPSGSPRETSGDRGRRRFREKHEEYNRSGKYHSTDEVESKILLKSLSNNSRNKSTSVSEIEKNIDNRINPNSSRLDSERKGRSPHNSDSHKNYRPNSKDDRKERHNSESRHRDGNKCRGKDFAQTEQWRDQSKHGDNYSRNLRSSSPSYERCDLKVTSSSRNCPEDDKYTKDSGKISKSRYVQDIDDSRFRDSRDRNRGLKPDKNLSSSNITLLKKRIVRYSVEKDPKDLRHVIKSNQKNKKEPKGNETGTKDDFASRKDIKGRRNDHLSNDLFKDLGPDVLQMSDEELERLLAGKLKELHANNQEVHQSDEDSLLLTDIDEGHLTETEELHEPDEVKEMYHQQNTFECTEVSRQGPEKNNTDLFKDNNNIKTNHCANNLDLKGNACPKINEIGQPTSSQFRTLFEARQHQKRSDRDNKKGFQSSEHMVPINEFLGVKSRTDINQKIINDMVEFRLRRNEMRATKDGENDLASSEDLLKSDCTNKGPQEIEKDTLSTKTKKVIDLDSYKKRQKVNLDLMQDHKEFKISTCERDTGKVTEQINEVSLKHTNVIKEANSNIDSKKQKQFDEHKNVLMKNSEQESNKQVLSTDTFTETRKERITNEKPLDNSETLRKDDNNEIDNTEYPSVIMEDLHRDGQSSFPAELKESNTICKDSNSFLHDFSLSEDEDSLENSTNFVNTNSDVPTPSKLGQKINILSVTIVKPMAFDVATTHDDFIKGDSSARESLECTKQIQESVQDGGVSTYQSHSDHALDKEELQKCLGGDAVELNNLPKNSEDFTVVKGKEVGKIDSMNTGSDASLKEGKRNIDEQLRLLFGNLTPSPSKPTSPVASRVPQKTPGIEQAKRNLLVGSESITKVNTVNTADQRRKKSIRSKSVDDTLLTNVWRDAAKSDEIQTQNETHPKCFSTREVKHGEKCFPYFANNPNYIPKPIGQTAFDSSNQYIMKKLQEYEETRRVEETNQIITPENLTVIKCEEKKKDKKAQKPKQQNTAVNKEPCSKTNEICEPEKKKKAKNARIKIKMFPNHSKKLKGVDNSSEGNQNKKKRKASHSPVEGASSYVVSTSEVSSSESETKTKRKKQNNKRSSTKPNSKKVNNKIKNAKNLELSNLNLQSTESVKTESKKDIVTQQQQEVCARTVETYQITECVEEENKETVLETQMEVRKGSRVRKQPRYYQSIVSEQKSSLNSPKKKSPRRITPVKVGEVSRSKKPPFPKQISGKRKFDNSNEEYRPEKNPKVASTVEKCNQSPLPHMEEMLKHLERKTSDSEFQPYVYMPTMHSNKDMSVVIEPTRQDQSFTDSLHQINLDTKDVALLGTFERGIFDNMSEYLLDKSLPSLESVKDKSSNPSNREGVNQLDFSNFLSKSTNTSTPIKQAKGRDSQESVNSFSGDKNSSQVSNNSSPKSYLITPLKRDRRKRVRIELIDIT